MSTLLHSSDAVPTSSVRFGHHRTSFFFSAQGDIKKQSGKLEDAVRLGHEALALADQQDELWRQAEARTLLAGSYERAKQFERSHALMMEARALSEKAQDWVSLARAHNLAAILSDAQDYY